MSIPRNLSKLADGADSSGVLKVDSGGTGATNAPDARTNLGLGTAATTDSTAYATAAQGILADNAVSAITSLDGSVVITPTGTSRDLSVTSSTTLISQVRNETGATLTKGTVVYISGAAGNKALVSKAIATGDTTSAQTYGMVQADIPDNQNGYVVVIGVVSGLNTLAFAEGVQLYLSPTTAGTYTSTKPYAPSHLVYVGVVTRVHANQGTIEVKIQNGYEMDELHDVSAQNPANGDTLVYVSSTDLWTKTPQSSLSVASAAAVPFSGVTGKPTTLSGYGITDAYSSSNPAGYISGITSSNVTTALGYTPYNATNPSGYISGITSGMVTTALGYTPYNATNPNSYITTAQARSAISVTGAGSYDSATGVINVVGGVTSFNTRTGAITLSSGDVTGALGFTPYNATNPSGYITGITSSNVTTALGFTPYNATNPSGYISGITSGMVTTALGFTPYNSTNPSGYITSSALSLYLTTASAASTYLALSGGTVTGTTYINTGGGYPLQLSSSQRYMLQLRNTGNSINSGYGWWFATDTNFNFAMHADGLGDVLTLTRSGALTLNGNTVLHAGNYSSYSPTLTGTGASGTWGINVTGNAGSLTATTSTGIQTNYVAGINTTTPGQTTYGIAFSGSSSTDNAQGITWGWSGTAAQAGIYVQSSGAYGTKMYFGTTDSFATGSKTSMSIDHVGTIQVPRSYLQSDYSLRAPIFYDSNDTSRYVDPNGTSQINYIRTGNVLNIGGVLGDASIAGSNFHGIEFHTEGNRDYYIGKPAGAWTQPLHIYFYTGTRIYSHQAYDSGTSIYNIASGNIQASFGTGGDNVYLYRTTYTPSIYDYNDTAYYADFNNTTTSINVNGSIVINNGASSNTHGLKLNGSNSRIWFDGRRAIEGDVSGTQFQLGEGYTYTTIYNQTRSPIYYDSNNTGYYTDPASTSRMSNINYDNLYFAGDTTYGLIGRNGYLDTVNGRGSDPLELNYYDGGPVKIGTGASGSKALYASELYSTILYDSTDTSYYFNGDGVTRLNVAMFIGPIRRNSSVAGWFEGTYNNVGDNSMKSNPIYTIGSSYNPADTTLSNMYGVGYSHPNFFGSSRGSGWGLYTAAAGSFTGVFGAESGFNTWISGYGVATGSWRAPIFYDSDNTGYYLDPASTSELNRIGTVRTNNFLYLDNNYGHSIVGVYSSYRYQGVFAMGDSYKLPASGETTGNLYGIAWSHPNAGGTAGNLNTHGALILENGTFLAALSGSIRCRDDMRTPIYYDSNDTGYYTDPNNTSRTADIHTNRIGVGQGVNGSWPLIVSGNAYLNAGGYGQAEGSWRAPLFYDSNDTGYYINPNGTSQLSYVLANDWFRPQGGSGVYWQDYGRGIRAADSEFSYGNIGTYGGGLNGWRGYGIWPNNAILMYNGSSGGFYNPQWGWMMNMDMNGNTTFGGNVTAYSDLRLKHNVREIDNVIERRNTLALAAIKYERDGRTRIGYGAQTLRDNGCSEFVMEADDALKLATGLGTLSVDYGETTAVLAVTSKLADERIAALEAKVEQLMEIINAIRNT